MWDTNGPKAMEILGFLMVNGAVEKTRTSTGCPTATSTLRVYQFRHDRIVVGAGMHRLAACSKSFPAKQGHKRQ
jgi:hypothetical protein